MKLIQLNAWGGKLGGQIIKLLQDEKPDIVCLQEIMSLEGGETGFFTRIEDIEKVYSFADVFLSPVFSLKFMQRKAHFGNAIMSQVKFQSKKVVFTNLTHKDNFDFDNDDYNVRNLQHVDVEVDGRLFNILNHHGHHIPEHKNGDAETMRQMKIIRGYLDELTGPIILTGDFNLSPKSSSLELINRRLINLSLKFNLKTTRNVLTHKTEVCDYVFVSRDIKVKKFYLSDMLASDHAALVLEFDI
jgi:endonuclease/exonuclease/phosphatase family metal-dependent hydrolase